MSSGYNVDNVNNVKSFEMGVFWCMASIPYLCGGTFFRLLLNAAKPTISHRERVEGKSDAIHESDILWALLRFVHHGIPDQKGKSFKTYTSNFKKCAGNIGQELIFKDEDIKKDFRKRMTNEYSIIQRAAMEFCGEYLQEVKHERLVKQMIELIRDDVSIDRNRLFRVDVMTRVPKSELPKVEKINLPDFLLSVWLFIVMEHNDNNSGSATVEQWDLLNIKGESIEQVIAVSCVCNDAVEKSKEEIAVSDNRGAAELRRDVACEMDGKSVPGLFVLNETVLEAYKKGMDSPIVATYRKISAKIEHILCAVCSGAAEECVLENRKDTLVDFIQQEIKEDKQAIFLLGNGGIGKTTALVQAAVRICDTEKMVYLFQLGGENDSQIMDEIIKRVARSKGAGEEQKYVLFIDSPCNNSDVLRVLLNEVQYYDKSVQVVISERRNRFDLIVDDVMPELYFSHNH